MLKTYEIMIENGQVTWLEEQPTIASARAIITILEDKPIERKILARQASRLLAQMGGSQPDLQYVPRRQEISDDFS